MAVDWTLIVPIVIGALVTFQGAASTLLGRIGGPAFATWLVFTVPVIPALITFLIETKAATTVTFTQGAAEAPWFSYCGGFMGPFIVWSVLTCVPKIGVNLFFSIQVSAQLLSALLFQHFGAVGVVKRAASVGMIVGLALTIVGVLVILLAKLRSVGQAAAPLLLLQTEYAATSSRTSTIDTPERIDFLASDKASSSDASTRELLQVEDAPQHQLQTESEAVSLLKYGICLVWGIFSGVAASLQAGMNSTLGIKYNSAAFATFIVACVAFVPCSIAYAVEYTRCPTNFKKVRAETPWWCYPCGLVGFGIVMMFSYLPQRLDSSVLMGALVCTQILSSLAADHFGWWGLSVNRVTVLKGVGASLLVGGVIVMSVWN
ncbi:hypothetical protein BJ741DRAFT_627201 [Chytriomyces cf. hyalinus JEL632]|nr:hypothetical protein BJ741DRAFT_627201 [Chytriomyces cf. hyalinus JEL632]